MSLKNIMATHAKAGIAFIALCLLVMAVWLPMAGCTKEYSFEARLVDTMANNNAPNPVLSSCSLCRSNVLPDSSWRFTLDGVVYCGKVEQTVIPLERTLFTFFGPSSCSTDSGFVASVYVDNEPLNSDKTNVHARLTCYYYDKVKPSFLFMSQAGNYLQFIITNYVYQTGIATGTFGGFVFTENGTRKEIKNGQFRLRLNR